MTVAPTVRELEGKRTLSILLFLFENGRVKKSDLYTKVSQTATMASKLDYLELNGLITLDQRKFENNTTYVELTPAGKSIAKRLLDVQDILSGEMIIDSDLDIDHNFSLVKKNEPENASNIPSERWKFIKRPCADTLLFTILQYSSITMADLKKRCKGEEAHLEDRIREAESLDLILGLHPDGPKSEIRYSLTIDGRNMAENLRRSMECQEVVSMDYDAPSEQENKVG